MKIIYEENPLATRVILDDLNKKLLYLKLVEDELVSYCTSVKLRFEKGSSLYDPEKGADKAVNFDEEKIEARAKVLLDYAISELQSLHCGDCTCVPASCMKCSAEYLLGIDTMPRLGKHSARKIASAFICDPGKSVTIDQAIEKLANYKILTYEENEAYRNSKISEEQYNSYIPGWQAQADAAHVWLVEYKKRHFTPIETLGAEFEKIWDDNVDKLYER